VGGRVLEQGREAGSARRRRTNVTPFPADDVSVDFARGRLNGSHLPDLVVSRSETRFHLVEKAARGFKDTVKPNPGYFCTIRAKFDVPPDYLHQS
jgi:hypothetical protein